MKDKEKGFSLLEILLAATILGVGIVTLLGALTQAARTMANVKETTEASGLARSKMEEVLTTMELNPYREEGYFDKPFNSYGWRVSVSEYQSRHDEDETDGLLLIYVEVYWDRGKKEVQYFLETLRLQEMPKLAVPIGAGAGRRDVQRIDSKKDRATQPSGSLVPGAVDAEVSPRDSSGAMDAFFGQK